MGLNSLGGIPDTDEYFSLIITLQQVLQASRAFLKAITNVVSVLELPLFDKGIQMLDGLWELLGVVEVYEALDGCSFYDDTRIVFDAVRLLLALSIGTIRTDGSTGYYPTLLANVHEDFIEHFATHIVEIDVDPLRETLLQAILERLLLVVYHVVDSQTLQVLAFIIAAGYATHLAPCQLGQLHRDLSH